MRIGRALGRLCLPLGILLAGCQHPAPTRNLPSRPSWEMYPRASSPPSTCPGQYRSVIEDASGTIFLGCWGGEVN